MSRKIVETAAENPRLRKIRTQRCSLCLKKRNVVRIEHTIPHSFWRKDSETLRVHLCVGCLLLAALQLTDEKVKTEGK